MDTRAHCTQLASARQRDETTRVNLLYCAVAQQLSSPSASQQSMHSTHCSLRAGSTLSRKSSLHNTNKKKRKKKSGRV